MGMKKGSKHLLAMFMVGCMVLFSIPMGVFAKEVNEDQSISSYGADVSYTIQNETDLNNAVAAIKASGETTATIVLGQSVTTATPFNGVEGVHITLKSTEGQTYKLNMGTNLIGDMTFDNVDCYTYNSTVYANGHLFETTDNYNSNILSLYGGSFKSDVDGDTNLVIKGGHISFVYGGGLDGNVSGSTNITINSTNNLLGTVFGGGLAKDTKTGLVMGNTNITRNVFLNNKIFEITDFTFRFIYV